MSEKIEINAQNFELTDAIRDMATAKFKRLFEHNKDILNVHITLSVEHIHHVGKALIHIPGTELHAHFSSKDMYKTIDGLAHKLDAQLQKHKGQH